MCDFFDDLELTDEDFMDDFFNDLCEINEAERDHCLILDDSKGSIFCYKSAYKNDGKCIMNLKDNKNRGVTFFVAEGKLKDYFEKFNNNDRKIWYDFSLFSKESPGGFLDRSYQEIFTILRDNVYNEHCFGERKTDFSKSINYGNKVSNLIDTILLEGDIKYQEMWLLKYKANRFVLVRHDLPQWLSFLNVQIPIRFVNEDEMEDRMIPKMGRNSDDTFDMAAVMESLGLYITDSNHNNEIRICPHRIKKVANTNQISEENLFIIVYLHELAHAVLDPNNLVDYCSYSGTYLQEYSEKMPSQVFGIEAEAMEESLANTIMLAYLAWYEEVDPQKGSNLYDDAVKFVGQQMPIYSFAIYQFKTGVDWTKWRDCNNKNTPALKTWFDKCFKEGKIRENLIYSLSDYDEVFI